MDNLFSLFKQAKHILNGLESYDASTLDYEIFDYYQLEVITNTPREIEYIDFAKKDMYSLATDGILAYNRITSVLIINVDEIESNILDESTVHALLLGPDVEKIRNHVLLEAPRLRYLYVSHDNQYYVSSNHVLYSKDYHELICYASLKPETEYHVSLKTKVIKKYAFWYATNLNKLYIPKNCKIEDISKLKNIHVIFEE